MKEFTLVVNQEILILIDKALQNMPYKDAAWVIGEINKQLIGQANTVSVEEGTDKTN